ncbi:MAG: ribosomal protein S18-alanine N-acetyltransferase [Clostridia bacterium]|nr:ribosomal protein S18-alanine N-acetyltransferase [Clostridia bacterium]
MKAVMCTADDSEEIAALEKAVISVPWSERDIKYALEGNDGYAVFKVVNGANRLMGYGGVKIAAGEGEIMNVAVRPEYRRKGVGRLIVEKIIAHCAENGVKKIWLEVYEKNLPAVSLYTCCGFSAAYARKNYYKEGDALIMSCEVSCTGSVKE